MNSTGVFPPLDSLVLSSVICDWPLWIFKETLYVEGKGMLYMYVDVFGDFASYSILTSRSNLSTIVVLDNPIAKESVSLLMVK